MEFFALFMYLLVSEPTVQFYKAFGESVSQQSESIGWGLGFRVRIPAGAVGVDVCAGAVAGRAVDSDLPLAAGGPADRWPRSWPSAAARNPRPDTGRIQGLA